MKGKLIVFEGHDGSGKTTLINKIAPILKKKGFNVKEIYFSSLLRKKTTLHRTFSLIAKLILSWFYILTGKIVLTDRYIYLTFRKIKLLNRLIIALFPKPKIVFILKATPEVLLKRRSRFEGIGKKLLKRKGVQLTKEQIKELYDIYESVPNSMIINTSLSINRSIISIMDKLKLYDIN